MKGLQAVEASNAVRNGWEAVGTLKAWNDSTFKTDAMMAHAEGKLFKPHSTGAINPTAQVGVCLRACSACMLCSLCCLYATELINSKS